MVPSAKLSPETVTLERIRTARVENPAMRERDLAAQLGISKAEFIAAWCGEGVRRIQPRVGEILVGLNAVGEVMALTRNESAVHEKIGVYENVSMGEHASLVLGTEIDLRVFQNQWVHGFAVEKRDGDDVRRGLQFFDAQGEAVHKIHLRPSSNTDAYEALVSSLLSADQAQSVDVIPTAPTDTATDTPGASVEDLRDRWSRLTDVHQFFGMLRSLKLDRRQAVHMVGHDYAWPLNTSSLLAMLHQSVESALPIMCFVGSAGCIQIHSGPIFNVKPMGPWINVLDETFHLHLRLDYVREVWGVRKPTKDGHVTSLEAYDAEGRMIIQFFGKRHEGEEEISGWRSLVENLPRVPVSTAA